MKKLLFLLFLLPILAFGQQTSWSTSPSGWTALSSYAIRYKANTPDSTNSLLIFNPLTGKYNQVYTAVEANKRFAKITDSLLHGFGLTQAGKRLRVDTSTVQTVANFFPKADTRYVTQYYLNHNPTLSNGFSTGGLVTLTGGLILNGGVFIFEGANDGGLLFADGSGNISQANNIKRKNNGLSLGTGGVTIGNAILGLYSTTAQGFQQQILSAAQIASISVTSSDDGLSAYQYDGTKGTYTYINGSGWERTLTTLDIGGGTLTHTLTPGYGISGSAFNNSTDRTWTADTTSSGGLVSKSRLATNLGDYLPYAGATTDVISGHNASFAKYAVTGTGGAGFIDLLAQSSPPSTPAVNHNIISADASGRFTVTGSNGFGWTVSKSLLTATRVQNVPDSTGTYALENRIIPINNLAASTISGVFLGNNLSALTLGRGLIGTSYNGSAGVTAILDTTQNYTWPKLQTYTLGITTGTGAQNSFLGGFTTNGNTASNLDVAVGGSSSPGFTQANLLIPGVTTWNAHAFFNGNSTTTVATNGGYFNVQVAASPSTTATSGTHAVFAQFIANQFGGITNAGASVTNAYIGLFRPNYQTTFGNITGGSGYSTPGTYTAVPLTGGTGTGAIATIVVASGAVTTVLVTTPGAGYVKGDVLSCLASNIGGGGSSFAYTLNTNSYGIGNFGDYTQFGRTSGSVTYNVPAAVTAYALTAPSGPPASNGQSISYTTAGVGSFVTTAKGANATLSSGTTVITVTGVTTSSVCVAGEQSGSGNSLTIRYKAVCTLNTITITALVAADTINTADNSVVSYIYLAL